jgi:DNA-binding NarL/FixJ family response regulator
MIFAAEESFQAKKYIFVVEDQAAVREGIVETLNREADLGVCGEADDVPPALSAIPHTHPDLVLTDIKLKTSNGLQLIRELRRLYPTLPIVAMTLFDPVGCERQAVAAGATSFALKQEGADKLISVIRKALEK